MAKVEGGVAAPPADDEAESKRLKSAVFSRKLLSRRAAKPGHPLEPSKLVQKHNGRDIVKKGHRKNKFLFSLPGLLAPVSGGKIGELASLNTRNPVLYLEFPQGRMKLFGTIVYPKNKYLTLQFSKSSKGVLCEDSFENMVVFSEAWWIGSPEENPNEIRLDFPEEFVAEKNLDGDFKGGAGSLSENTHQTKESYEQSSSDNQSSDGQDVREEPKITKQETPARQSARTAGKAMNFTEASEDDSSSSLGDEAKVSEVIHRITTSATKSSKQTLKVDPKVEVSLSPLEREEGKSGGKRGALVHGRVKKGSTRSACSSSARKKGVGATRRSGAKKSSSDVKVSQESSNDESPSGMEDTDQETDDSDEDWTC